MLLSVEAAKPGPLDVHLAAMEADLALGFPPAVRSPVTASCTIASSAKNQFNTCKGRSWSMLSARQRCASSGVRSLTATNIESTMRLRRPRRTRNCSDGLSFPRLTIAKLRGGHYFSRCPVQEVFQVVLAHTGHGASSTPRSKKRMARPVASSFFEWGMIGLHQRIRPRTKSRPRWRYARPGPHKLFGVERHFFDQVSRTPFDCQAISLPPLANTVSSSAPHMRRPADD